MSLWPPCPPGHLAPPSRTDQPRRNGRESAILAQAPLREGTGPPNVTLPNCPDQEHTRTHIQTTRATPGGEGLEFTAEFKSCSTTFCVGNSL